MCGIGKYNAITGIPRSGALNYDSYTNDAADYTCGGSAHSGLVGMRITFNASNSNNIYGKSTTVQPPVYVTNIWRRKS